MSSTFTACALLSSLWIARTRSRGSGASVEVDARSAAGIERVHLVLPVKPAS